MFTNKLSNGRNNICGNIIERRRKEMSKNIDSEALEGLKNDLIDVIDRHLDIDKNAVQRIESGKRFVTDIELTFIAKVLNLSYDQLLHPSNDDKT